jgi:hypothetical protein
VAAPAKDLGPAQDDVVAPRKQAEKQTEKA